MKQRARSNLSTYIIGLVCLIGMVSCSKKIRYTAPVALSKEYVSNLSSEKQMAYSFVTAPRNGESELDKLVSDSFYSHDQHWNGQKETFIKKRISDSSFSKIEPIRILQDDSLVAIHSRMFGDTLRFRWDIVRIGQQQIQEHWSNVNDSIGINPNKHT